MDMQDSLELDNKLAFELVKPVVEELRVAEAPLPLQDLWSELNDLYVELECRTRARGGSLVSAPVLRRHDEPTITSPASPIGNSVRRYA